MLEAENPRQAFCLFNIAVIFSVAHQLRLGVLDLVALVQEHEVPQWRARLVVIFCRVPRQFDWWYHQCLKDKPQTGRLCQRSAQLRLRQGARVSDSREGARQSEPSGIPHGQLVRVYFTSMHLLSRLAAPATPHCAAPCRMSSAARPAWRTRSAVRCLCSASGSDSCQLLEVQLCHAANRAQYTGECAFGNAAPLTEHA